MARIGPNISVVLAMTVIAQLALVGSALGLTAAPSPEALPSNVVAVISHVPVSLGTITKVELRRGIVQASAGEGRSSVPRPGGRAYARLEENALRDWLELIWVQGEAADMGIELTPRRVERELAYLKEQFGSEKAYRRFLKEYHFTRREVRERLEVQMLSEAIMRRVTRGTVGEVESRDAIREFVDAYGERWKARTVCAPDYAFDRCSNG